MVDTPKHSVSVAGVVVDDLDRVLIIQRRDNGRWEPPGGVLELDEAPLDGVVREVMEETGVKVAVERLTGVYKNINRAVVALVFRCSPIEGTAAARAESKKSLWVSREEVKRKMLPAYSIRIEDAFGVDARIRVHDGTNLIS